LERPIDGIRLANSPFLYNRVRRQEKEKEQTELTFCEQFAYVEMQLLVSSWRLAGFASPAVQGT